MRKSDWCDRIYIVFGGCWTTKSRHNKHGSVAQNLCRFMEHGEVSPLSLSLTISALSLDLLQPFMQRIRLSKITFELI